MAANDPGLAPMSALAEDPVKGEVAGDTILEDERPVAPDQFDEKYETTKWEIYAWYLYYIGNNGLTLFNFAPTAFQNLLYQSADANGMLMFAGRNRTINSIVLLSNGISFAIQIVVFLVIGSYADFGTWRPNILIVLSIIAFAIGFGWLGIHTPDKWQAATGMYIVGLIAYQTTLTFWTAAFPGLARNTPHIRKKAEEYNAAKITRDQYDFADSMKRNELSNIAFYIQSCGEIIILAIIVGVLFGVNVNASVANNNWGLSVLIAFATGCWVLLAIPWFIMEKRRPGQQLPPGMNIVSVGFWQLWRALTQIWKLKQSLIYLIGYFLLGDSLNTTVTVIATLQNTVVEYDTLTLTYLLLEGIAAQAVGIYTFWFIQRRYGINTKIMFNCVAFGIILLDGWGMIGVCLPTQISEVTPRGKEFLFFSLFSIIGKTSSFVGPLVSSAIIDDTGNNSTPFYFLFALSICSFLLLVFFVDLKKSRREQAKFLENERMHREKMNLEKGSGSASLRS
ncbi:MAG: hypothetical protein M1827_005844 [Pycnora praestabilis]|nr:MAG: hypothetical protein M1827_005844 [Pycnora praestabilis]